MDPKEGEPPDSSSSPRGTSLLVSLRDRLAVEPALELQAAPGADATAVTFRPGDQRRYANLEVIGEGAFGKVYRAFDRDLKRELAIKVLKPRSGHGQEDIKRFVEEAQATAQLGHPNIVPVHELGETEGGLYYTMKLVRGRTLADVIAALGAGDRDAAREWTLTRLVQVFLQVCQAIDFAHSRGVIHRDLKPSNLMLGDYGEVIVMDWGLSKVVVEGHVITEGFAARTGSGAIVGSPHYMSPEQAAGENHHVDARSDVWSLGVILYEVLTLAVPFAAENMARLLARILMEEPEPPRRRAPVREIPLELERICLKAMSKARDHRQSSVRELHDAVQRWLESEAERSKRRQRAEERAREGREKLGVYRHLKEEVRRLEGEAAEAEKRFPGWRPVEEKAPLLEAEKAVAAARKRLTHAAVRTVSILTEALGFDPEHPGAREALADYYWDRFLDAEERQDGEGSEFFGELVAAYHDGKYTRELRGDGSLSIDSRPAGVEAWLYEFAEDGFMLTAANRRRLGCTPIGPIPLPMGSYLVVLRKEGFREVRYPVFIAREKDWSADVQLYADEEIGPDFVYVPAGPFLQGGDAETHGWSLARAEVWVDDLFLAEHPVTAAEYLEFLNQLARDGGLRQARERAPRPAADAPTYLVENARGELVLPEVDAEGDGWHPRMPVIGVSWQDAIAYCEWRSRRDRRRYRLPSEVEWEKAARGVDGRWYPWGNRFDPSLCNMRESRRERAAPVPVDEFPSDRSVYGVRGLAGNVRDWTATELIEGEGEKARMLCVVRGGSWNNNRVRSRCAYRFWLGLSSVDGYLGFRLVAERPKRPPEASGRRN